MGEHAVYPGTFDPVTPGHLDIMERARHLFTRITVLVAVNSDKQPSGSESERAAKVRRELPAGLHYEYQLAAMNEALGITTLLLPRPELTAMSSTPSRGMTRQPTLD